MKYALGVYKDNIIKGFWDHEDFRCYTKFIKTYETKDEALEVFKVAVPAITHNYGTDHLLVIITLSMGMDDIEQDMQKYLDIVKEHWGNHMPYRIEAVEKTINKAKGTLEIL